MIKERTLIAETSLSGPPRHAARLAAVQALYQLELSDSTPDSVVAEFLRHRLEPAGEDEESGGVDTVLFADLVRGATARRAELDAAIEGVLAEGWALDRLGTVLLAILRAGAYELRTRTDIPPRVTINEFVDVAHAFFAGKEPGFVNGVLDRLARVLRPAEMETSAGERHARTG